MNNSLNGNGGGEEMAEKEMAFCFVIVLVKSFEILLNRNEYYYVRHTNEPIEMVQLDLVNCGLDSNWVDTHSSTEKEKEMLKN